MHTSSKATEPFVFVYAQRWHTDASGGMWGDGGVNGSDVLMLITASAVSGGAGIGGRDRGG